MLDVAAALRYMLAGLSGLAGGRLAWLGPPELGGQPVPDDAGRELDWLLNAPWAKVALLVTLAVGVLVLTSAAMRGKVKRRSLRRMPDFDLRVAKLADLPPVSIAAAPAGDVRLEGVLRRGEGALGEGPRACVYTNRAGSTRSTAIAAELVLLTDDGEAVIGLEQLERARVIAPRQTDGPHDSISLFLGDRVEVLGELLLFAEPQRIGEGRLRGMLGSLGSIQIRVLERAEQSEAAAAPAPDSAPHPSSGSAPEPPPDQALPTPTANATDETAP